MTKPTRKRIKRQFYQQFNTNFSYENKSEEKESLTMMYIEIRTILIIG
jgi:hypothetical protein